MDKAEEIIQKFLYLSIPGDKSQASKGRRLSKSKVSIRDLKRKQEKSDHPVKSEKNFTWKVKSFNSKKSQVLIQIDFVQPASISFDNDVDELEIKIC